MERATGMKSTGIEALTPDDTVTPTAMVARANALFDLGLNEASMAQEKLLDLMLTAVTERARLEQLKVDLNSIELRVVRDTAVPDRSNEKSREALYREVLEDDEEYASKEQEELELSETYGATRAQIEVQTDIMGIARRKMEFATALLTAIGGLTIYTAREGKP